MLTPVLDEVFSSLVPLRYKWSESVSDTEPFRPLQLVERERVITKYIPAVYKTVVKTGKKQYTRRSENER